MMGGRALFGAVAGLVLFVGACTDPLLPPTQLTVSPSPVALALGERATLTASLRDEDGGIVVDLVTWSSSDPSIASVSAGLVTALQPGTAEITATASGLVATVDVTVEDRVSPTVTVLSPLPDATVEGSVSVAARVNDDHDVTGVSLLVDGVEVAAVAEPAGGKSVTTTLTWDSDGAEEGLHTLTVEATDASGNIGTTSVAVMIEEEETPPFMLSVAGAVTSFGYNTATRFEECRSTLTASATGGAEGAKAEWLSGQREVRDVNGLVVRTDALDAGTLLDMFGSSHIASGETQVESRVDRESQKFDLLYTFRAELPDGTLRSMDVLLVCHD